ncbi:MAG TPA: hypothetical protein VHM90_08445 [Phycisphaerae bacterium]|nr:hypothetical protein [Phycisphaerae bacterium]
MNLLVLAGFLGFLAATGRLDKAKALTISDILKQQGAPEKLREKVYDIMSPASQPATGTAPATQHELGTGDEVAGGPATAQERLDYLQKLLEAERLRLDNQKQALDQRQESLRQQQALLEGARQDLAHQKEVFEAKVAATSNTKDQSGFQKTMELFAELKPKQVKDLLATMSTDDIAKYITTMEPDRAASVIAEFKTGSDKETISVVLDKIRGGTRPAGTGAASGTPAETVSSAGMKSTPVPVANGKGN